MALALMPPLHVQSFTKLALVHVQKLSVLLLVAGCILRIMICPIRVLTQAKTATTRLWLYRFCPCKQTSVLSWQPLRRLTSSSIVDCVGQRPAMASLLIFVMSMLHLHG